ncbi:hypothetical protein FB45DRAFT_1006821, partial [Roridomyces roridus]
MSAPLAFSDLPLDVILELTRECDLEDSLKLALTGTKCAAILRSRYFWITALERVEKFHRRPLTCASGTDITTLPLETLRKTAIHAYKLRKSWTSALPPAVSVRAFTLPNDYELLSIFPVYGLDMILTVSDVCLACWSTTSGACLSTYNRDPEDPVWVPSASPVLSPGRCSVGFAYQNEHQIKLEIVTVDYRTFPDLSVSSTYSGSWKCKPWKIVSVLMGHDTMGVVMWEPNEIPLLCHGRLRDKRAGLLELGLESQDYDSETVIEGLALDDYVVVTVQSADELLNVVHAKRESSGFSMWTESVDVPPLDSGHDSDTFYVGRSNVRHPAYGVFNVSMRRALWSEDLSNYEVNRVLFWPAEHNPHSSSWKLSVGPVCSYEHP